MINRLKDRLGPPEDAGGPEDQGYWEVDAKTAGYAVTRATAAALEEALDRRRPPRWLVFRDLSGSRHRVRTKDVTRVSESTAAQRAAGRAFYRARRLELKAERRPWEEDD